MATLHLGSSRVLHNWFACSIAMPLWSLHEICGHTFHVACTYTYRIMGTFARPRHTANFSLDFWLPTAALVIGVPPAYQNNVPNPFNGITFPGLRWVAQAS